MRMTMHIVLVGIESLVVTKRRCKMKNEKGNFEYTVEGCRLAKKYIKSIGKQYDLDNYKFDGYGIIALANRLYEKEINEKK